MRSQGITLLLMPPGMGKRKRNSSKYEHTPCTCTYLYSMDVYVYKLYKCAHIGFIYIINVVCLNLKSHFALFPSPLVSLFVFSGVRQMGTRCTGASSGASLTPPYRSSASRTRMMRTGPSSKPSTHTSIQKRWDKRQ